MELDRGGINCTAQIRQRCELLKGLGGLMEASATSRDLNELRVKFGREETGDHVGYFGNKVRVQGMALGKGFSREPMSETGENHGNSIIRGKGEIGLGYVRLELINNSSEDRVGEAI